jgi:DNA-binding transcriptional regulator YdaS (Cro superfamily)
MKLTKWLAAEPGRAVAMARYFGISKQAVDQWGDLKVPRDKMAEVRDYTHGQVRLEDMIAPPSGRLPPAPRTATVTE